MQYAKIKGCKYADSIVPLDSHDGSSPSILELIESGIGVEDYSQ